MEDLGDPVVERAKARVGTTLKEKWRLDRLLGVGGMAAVYAATHRNGNRVAVKILHSELSVHAEIRSRFLREGYVANKVGHPGAVSVLDDEVAEDGDVFLVMELLEGRTLNEWWSRKSPAVPMDELLLIVDQMLDVLSAAHANSIIHRDIKPDNVFLTRAGIVKLLDFGIARLRELSESSAATRSGALMGTPAYMAPEQARARWDEVDARTDLWAVGASMYKVITGRPVHEAETVSEQLLAAMTHPAKSLAAAREGVPTPLVEVVDRALAFDKKDRWADASDMQAAVRNAYRAMTGVPVESANSLIDADGDAASDRPAKSGRNALRSRTGTTVAVASAGAEGRHSALGRWFLVAATAIVGAFLFGYFGLRKTPPASLVALLADGRVDSGTAAGARAHNPASSTPTLGVAVSAPAPSQEARSEEIAPDPPTQAPSDSPGAADPSDPASSESTAPPHPDPSAPPALPISAKPAAAPSARSTKNAPPTPTHKEPQKKPSAKKPHHR